MLRNDKNNLGVKSVLTNCEIPRTLLAPGKEELVFWLHIMHEHAIFIRMGLPCNERELIREAVDFANDFQKLQTRAQGINGSSNFLEVVNLALELVIEFREYKLRILRLRLTCQLGGTNFPLFLDHVSREAEYLILLLEKARRTEMSNQVSRNISSLTGETVFWHRIMADHSKFIRQFLDPSERKLIDMAQDFSHEFDDFYHQAKDFQSMLRGFKPVGAFERFVDQSQESVEQLRDFKGSAEKLIRECKLLGNITADLAHHVKEEAQYFLKVLARIEGAI